MEKEMHIRKGVQPTLNKRFKASEIGFLGWFGGLGFCLGLGFYRCLFGAFLCLLSGFLGLGW